MHLNNQIQLTDTYISSADFTPLDSSIYVFGTSEEERSAIPHELQNKPGDVEYIHVIRQGSTDFTVTSHGQESQYRLRSQEQLRRFWSTDRQNIVYLDITGLSHHVWAPLLKSALAVHNCVKVVYREPYDYNLISSPTEGDIYDLSSETQGIRPIPGFASLREALDENVCFVPLLGFEGPRLIRLLEEVQLPGGKIIPVIGVPGFRPEYPFRTYYANRQPLTKSEAWKNIRYAAANCPFALFYLLQEVAVVHSGDFMKVAPIGTKPHALGAVLFCLASREPVELVYDHPIRKPKRTSGSSKLLVYHVSLLPPFDKHY